jgi:hypothetical protein
MEKTWTIQVSQLKVGVGPSSRINMPTWEMITTMRTWAVTKACRLKVVLSWTKTIWVMVRSMSELRQSTRRSVRQSARERAMRKIRKLIMIWVSGIIKAHPPNLLTSEAKLIQVTRTATKYANEGFHSWLGGFFPHFSLRVEVGLWIRWIVGFGWFECFLFFMVVGARNKHRDTPLTLVPTSLKINT